MLRVEMRERALAGLADPARGTDGVDDIGFGHGRISLWSGGNLVEGHALVGAVILRQAENLFGDGVEQHLVGAAGDAAGRGVDPAVGPIILDETMRVIGKAAAALEVDRELRQLLARANRDELVERAFGPRGHSRL